MSSAITEVKRVSCDNNNIDILLPARPCGGDGTAISRTQVAVSYEPARFARQEAPDVEVQINKLWDAKCKQNPRMYDESKFRLAGWEVKDGKWVVNVGLTCYKDLYGTNLAPNFRELQERGIKDFGNEQAYMANPIGVGMLLMTSDEYLIVTRRAGWTGEYPGALDRPGGHPEPGLVFTPDGSLRNQGTLPPDASLTPEQITTQVNEEVFKEIWHSAAQETEDELGITTDQLTDLTFLGIDLNMSAAARPSFEFFARTSLSSVEVRERYDAGGMKEADETADIHLIPPPTIIHLHRHLHSYQPSPSASGARQDAPSAVTLPQSLKGSVQDGEGAEEKHLQEARWLLSEASPALRGALILSQQHQLLPTA